MANVYISMPYTQYMPYIRIKNVHDSNYAYLVESKNTPSGPRQKVKKYLGKAILLERLPAIISEDLIVKDKQEFLRQLISRELRQHGFSSKQQQFHYENIVVSLPALTVTAKQKEVTLQLNEGFLSTYTLHRLFLFRKTKDHTVDAPVLARYFLEAGLPISPQEFVQFYQLL